MSKTEQEIDPRSPIISSWKGFPRYECPWADCQFDSLEYSTILEHISVGHPPKRPVVNVDNYVSGASEIPEEKMKPVKLDEEGNKVFNYDASVPEIIVSNEAEPPVRVEPVVAGSGDKTEDKANKKG